MSLKQGTELPVQPVLLPALLWLQLHWQLRLLWVTTPPRLLLLLLWLLKQL